MKTDGMRFPFTQDQIDEFWTKVDKTQGQGPEGTCWEWKGYTKNKEGYGGFYIKQIDNTMNTHKLAFMFVHNFQYGDIPRSLVIRHLCNNPKCVNPEHLALGTFKDNSQDMVKAGNSVRGEKNTKAVLTDEKVKEIRDLWVTDNYSRAALAVRFGVSEANIALIVSNKNWTDPNYIPPTTYKNHSIKFSEEQIADVKQSYSNGESGVSISKRTGISQTQTYNIIRGLQRGNT